MIVAYAALFVVVLAALAYADTHGETRPWRALGGRRLAIDACRTRFRRSRARARLLLDVGVESDVDFDRFRGTWVGVHLAGLGVRVALWR